MIKMRGDIQLSRNTIFQIAFVRSPTHDDNEYESFYPIFRFLDLETNSVKNYESDCFITYPYAEAILLYDFMMKHFHCAHTITTLHDENYNLYQIFFIYEDGRLIELEIRGKNIFFKNDSKDQTDDILGDISDETFTYILSFLEIESALDKQEISEDVKNNVISFFTSKKSTKKNSSSRSYL